MSLMAPTPARGSAPPLRVMLVDDHALVRSAVRQAINTGDVELVAEAATAEEAFALALSIRPDILLLDIDLPGMKGLQMLEEIAPRLPETKVVMLTVSGSERDMIDAIVAGRGGLPDQGPQPGSPAARAQGSTPRGSWRCHAASRRACCGTSPMPLGGDAPLVAPAALEGLSPRENDVLRMLADGLTDREIATALIISPRTVETHVSNILHKLEVRNRAEAAQRHRETG